MTKKMSPLALALSSGYTIAQSGVGLVLHPYQTMQEIARGKVFGWITLLPSLLLAILVIVWRYLALPLAQVFGRCYPNLMLICDGLVFFSDWIVFFCIYWQILLMYLYFRFSRAFNIR
jgi:hypothetical protein